MKKLLGIAALFLALTPFAQAQNGGAGMAGHPDARNDRSVESRRMVTRPSHTVARHVRHVKHRHSTHHRHVVHHAK